MSKITFLLAIALLLSILLFIITLGTFVRSQNSAQSDTAFINITYFGIGGGADNLTSDSINGSMGVGEWLAGGEYSGFGFFYTLNKSITIPEPNLTVYIWNGSTYKSDFNISFECAYAASFCEPQHQNASLNNASVRRGIMNLTNTGDRNILSIDFKINATCPWINLTFSNSTNLTQYARQTANATFKPLWGSLSSGSSFEIFLWANFTTPTISCDTETQFSTT